MTAVVVSLLAAALFGTLPLLIRRGLAIAPERAIAAFFQNGFGLVVCGAVALAARDFGGDPVAFLLIGLLVPGLIQLMFASGTAFSVAAVGAERPSPAVARIRGAARAHPPVGVALGLAYLCSLGTVLVVAGGGLIAVFR